MKEEKSAVAAEQAAQQEMGELLRIRRDKLAALQQEDKNPFAITKYPVDHYAAHIKEEFAGIANEEETGKVVRLGGRLMSKRLMGKASFADLRDSTGDIQLYVRRDNVGEEEYAAFKKFDIGDVVGVEGEIFRTKMGEISIKVEKIQLLSKSLRPLPEKWHGLKDTDLRYRQRYVDLIVKIGRAHV